jgi:hypothetical protein
MPQTPKDATPATAAANREAVALYEMEDGPGLRRRRARSHRGLQRPKVMGEDGKVLFDLSQFDSLQES